MFSSAPNAGGNIVLFMMFFRQTESLCTSAQTKLAPLNMDSAFSSYEYDCPAKYAPKASASRIRTAEIMRPIRPLPAFVTSIVFYHSPQHRCRLKYQMFFQNTNHLSRATFFIALCLIVFCERCEKIFIMKRNAPPYPTGSVLFLRNNAAHSQQGTLFIF